MPTRAPYSAPPQQRQPARPAAPAVARPQVRYFEWNGVTYREGPEGTRAVAGTPRVRGQANNFRSAQPTRAAQSRTIPPTRIASTPPNRTAAAPPRREPPIPKGRSGLRKWPAPKPKGVKQVSEYRWERREHGKWNPFVPNHTAYHWVPVKRQVVMPGAAPPGSVTPAALPPTLNGTPQARTASPRYPSYDYRRGVGSGRWTAREGEDELRR